jgi:hypothetical protein
MVEGKLYTFATPLCSGSISCVDIVHSFAPLFLHPWSTGGLLVIMVSVPSLWIVTPMLPGLKIVVYPFSTILLTLKSDFVSLGIMLASLALVHNCLNGSCVMLVACSVELSGRNTVILRLARLRSACFG